MAAIAALIPVEEYLRTEYDEGDREYIDGVVLERNLGERDRSVAQKRLIAWFVSREKPNGYFCFPEQRIQVAPTRYRVPDVSVYHGSEPQEQIFRTPPFLIIEILSPRDTFHTMQEKLGDYHAFGVPFVWVVDPGAKSGVVYTAHAWQPAKDGVLRTADPVIEVPLGEIF